VKTGRLSLDAERLVDTAELLRVGYQIAAAVLHAAAQQSHEHTPQTAAAARSTPPQHDVALQELQLVRQERDFLQQERNRLAQQVDVLLAVHQTTQQQLTQAQHMLHDMQHRYDRLLDMPRPAPAAAVPSPLAPAVPAPSRAESGDPRGTMRRRILVLLADAPEGLTPAEMRDQLQVERSLADTCLGMRRDGLLQRVGRGRYVVAG
jgi:hypothetical protein